VKIDIKTRAVDKFRKSSEKVFNLAFPRNLENRTSNYPFLGSDTYFNLCNFSITKRNDLNKLIGKPITSESKIFVVASLIPELLQLLKSNKIQSKNKALFILITEADNIFKTQELEALLNISEKIFASNLLGEHDKILKIPLGLEKQSFRSAGRRSDFIKQKRTSKERKYNFIIAWNDETNKNRNSYRRKFFAARKSLVINNRISARTLHKLMLKSLFVPSPAGNGLDCHRTWEALYLGCVPVVLSQDFCGDVTWPVLVVENWEELINKSQKELESIFNLNRMNFEESIEWSRGLIESIK
jgi:hypothetical protein